MARYEREDMENLMEFLWKENAYSLAGILEDWLNEGAFDFGFSLNGSIGALKALEELERIFPEVVVILFKTDYEHLPTHINDGIPGLVACWRFKRGEKEPLK